MLTHISIKPGAAQAPPSLLRPTHRTILPAAVLAMGWLLGALLVPDRAWSQSPATNSPADDLRHAVQWLAKVLDPPANEPPRTFTTTLKITQADGLPNGLAGAEAELALQAPDLLRLRLAAGGQSLVAGRLGQDLWFHIPAEHFGVTSLARAGAGSTTPGDRGVPPLGPMRVRLPVAQLEILPLLVDLQVQADASVGAVPCRVLDVTPKPEAVEALNLPRGTLRLWLRASDAVPLRLGYRDAKGAEVRIELANPRLEPAWPEERWQLKSNPGDRILTAANYFESYQARGPLNVTSNGPPELLAGAAGAGCTMSRFTFEGCRGEKIPALLSLPKIRPGQRLPVIVFLHGIGQSKSFLREITAPFNEAGFAMVSFDQYMQGERKLGPGQAGLAKLVAFMERPAKTINETRRLLDYLQTRPDLDPRRVYLVGASYGAVMGSTVLAQDKRLRAGVLVFGGGDFNRLLDSSVNHLGVAAALGLIDGRQFNPERPPLPRLTSAQERPVAAILDWVKLFAGRFLPAADPIHYASQISPTPVYFQNGTRDALVPAAAGQALQDAAKEPKKVTWYESDHVGIDRQQTLKVLEDGLRWLLEQDAPFRPPAGNNNRPATARPA